MASTKSRSERLGLRATSQQESVLRRAAEASNKSLTNFVLSSAGQAAEQTLPDQRLFTISEERSDTLLELLDRPAQDNAGSKDLFSRLAPWTDPGS